MRFVLLILLALFSVGAAFGGVATTNPHCLCAPCDCGAGCACRDLQPVQVIDHVPKPGPDPVIRPTLPAELIAAAKEVEAASKAVAKTAGSIDRAFATIANALEAVIAWAPSVAFLVLMMLVCVGVMIWPRRGARSNG